MDPYSGQLLSADQMAAHCARLREAGESVVFTNGAFDILHAGHLAYLKFAREQGSCLIVGLNSDASVKRYKGPDRPIIPCEDRAQLLLGLRCVDFVVVFEEDEPRDLIARLLPDILVKGADWSHYVSGQDVVEANGGRVILAELIAGKSSTRIIRQLKKD